MGSCEKCGGPKKSASRRFCSHKCSNSGVPRKKPTPTRLCITCSKEYKATKKSTSKYCSQHCFGAAAAKQDVLHEKQCVECSTTFLTRSARKTCSSACHSARANAGRGRVKREPKPCPICGTLTKNLKYCSQPCNAEGQRLPIEHYVERRREAKRARTAFLKSQSNKARREPLPDDERTAMLERQGGKCAICEVKEARVIDHCHTTGKIRGLLCYSCNTAIGALGDTVQGVMRGVRYLKQFEEASHSLA